MKNIILVISSISLLFIFGNCKSKSTNKTDEIASKNIDTLSNFPYWIAMMDDPKANYYLAIDAFEKYWSDRERPTEKDGEGIDIFEKDKKESEKKKPIELVYEYKRFLNWKEKYKDLVKPDGTIMSQEEIIELSTKMRDAK
ncbi:MAG: hypothetical protein WCI53_02455 [Bacteroidota bacterium]|jgi:hypothetical protein